nr:immunoglobulin heavy chain junction region [Mus musculus]
CARANWDSWFAYW